MVINTHFDHESGVAREKQAMALMRYISTITDYPVVLTGDFNCGASSKAYSNIVSSGMLTNSSTIAGNVITKGPTYTDYGTSNSTIDFVFVTHKKILVESYRVCNEKINGNYPSDHHPVLIEYTIY
jgi:endonuclease/exonuclease/phosphatase family metal-dependent hydrolase